MIRGTKRYLPVVLGISAFLFWGVPAHAMGKYFGKEQAGKEHGGQEHGVVQLVGQEHGGKEHAGKEHGGKEHGGSEQSEQEHGGQEHGGQEHGGAEPAGQEHGGQEHGGQEHGGKEHGGSEQGEQEHGGQEHGGAEHGGAEVEQPTLEPTAENIRQSIRDYIAGIESGEGSFTIYDEILGDIRTLELVGVHERVGKTGDLYYSCTDMRDTATGEVLDLDFDVEAMPGDLNVTDVRIHKLEGQARYTYDENDNRIPLS